MLTRINKLNNINDDYTIGKIGNPPIASASPEEVKRLKDLHHKRYESLYAAYTRTYVENTFMIRVPFFGFTFDVNDLGILGGLALLILLTILRFCLSREINNLELSFLEASGKPLRKFYHLLAMRQVLTVPQTDRYRPKGFLLSIPKVLCFLPFAVHLAVTIHDLLTMGMFWETWHTMIVVVGDFLLLIFIGGVTFMVITRLLRIDLMWSQCWFAVKTNSSYKPPDEDMKTSQLLNTWRDLFIKKTDENDVDGSVSAQSV
jgi:hypothetical protein